MFKKNELVMYGGTGVCKVVDIGRPDFSDSDEQLYYFLEPIYQQGIIYAPVDNEKISMRPVISADEANALIDSIDDIHAEIYKSSSMQQLSQHYQDIISSYSCHSLLKLAKSIHAKDTEAQKHNKKLGQIDKRFMKRAEDLLFGEFAAALKMDKERIADYIHGKLERTANR